MSLHGHNILLHRVAVLIGECIIFYDYLLTFSIEVERFWIPRKSMTSTLFFLNRYIGLLGYVPTAYQLLSSSLSEQVCRSLQLYHRVLSSLVHILAAYLMTLRIYALYDRKTNIVAVLHVVIIVSIAFSVWSVFMREGSRTPAIYSKWTLCVPMLTETEARAITVAYSGQSIFDLATFLLVLYKAFEFRNRGHLPLIEVLLKDGTFYFVTSSMVILLNISILCFSPREYKTVGTPLVFSILTTMASRLTLNLRDPRLVIPDSETEPNSIPAPTQHVSTIVSLGYPSDPYSILRLRSSQFSSVVELDFIELPSPATLYSRSQ